VVNLAEEAGGWQEQIERSGGGGPSHRGGGDWGSSVQKAPDCDGLPSGGTLIVPSTTTLAAGVKVLERSHLDGVLPKGTVPPRDA